MNTIVTEMRFVSLSLEALTVIVNLVTLVMAKLFVQVEPPKGTNE